jgi:hypothetical protein
MKQHIKVMKDIPWQKAQSSTFNANRKELDLQLQYSKTYEEMKGTIEKAYISQFYPQLICSFKATDLMEDKKCLCEVI